MKCIGYSKLSKSYSLRSKVHSTHYYHCIFHLGRDWHNSTHPNRSCCHKWCRWLNFCIFRKERDKICTRFHRCTFLKDSNTHRLIRPQKCNRCIGSLESQNNWDMMSHKPHIEWLLYCKIDLEDNKPQAQIKYQWQSYKPNNHCLRTPYTPSKFHGRLCTILVESQNRTHKPHWDNLKRTPNLDAPGYCG